MATESSLNPIAIALHVLAIAIGVVLGLRAMDAIVPDLPAESVQPGVASSTAPGAVLGDDPNSLFRPDNLGQALDQLADQLPAGEQVSVLRIEPGSLNAQTGGGEGLVDVSELDPSLPALLAAEIHRRRDEVTLADIGSVELVSTRDGPEWYVQIDPSRTDASPPWTYGAPLAGTPLTAGGAPPEPAPSG